MNSLSPAIAIFCPKVPVVNPLTRTDGVGISVSPLPS